MQFYGLFTPGCRRLIHARRNNLASNDTTEFQRKHSNEANAKSINDQKNPGSQNEKKFFHIWQLLQVWIKAHAWNSMCWRS